jgi:uncharacterized membrane protein YbhN (UPF0104 family)
MASREQLLRLGETVAERATTKRVRAVAQVLLLAALVFLVLRARSLWHGSHVELSRIDWQALAVALALAVVGTAAGGLIWLAILGDLGVKTRRRWAGLFFQAQLGKYIPGSVWQYAGRAAIARTNGLPTREVAVSLPVEFVASAAAAGVIGAFLLGWWGAVVVTGAAGVLIAGRLARSGPPGVNATVRAALLYVPVWMSLGASFWFCARTFVGIPVHDLALYTGAFAIAWLAGLLAIYAPGGLGVREAVVVALLSGRLGAADALVVAAASRLLLMLADLGLAGIATATMRRRPELRLQTPPPG